MPDPDRPPNPARPGMRFVCDVPAPGHWIAFGSGSEGDCEVVAVGKMPFTVSEVEGAVMVSVGQRDGAKLMSLEDFR